jgi:hypothetical protein
MLLNHFSDVSLTADHHEGLYFSCADEPLNSFGAFKARATGILPLRSGSVEELLPSSRSRIIVLSDLPMITPRAELLSRPEKLDSSASSLEG